MSVVRKVSERPALTPPYGGSESTFISQLQGVTQQYGYAINQLLQAFEEGTFTPTFTFATPGDLSVSYSAQDGAFKRVGASVFVSSRIICTPTFSSASGDAQISLPFAAVSGIPIVTLSIMLQGTGTTWPLSQVDAFIRPAEAFAVPRFHGSGSVGSNMVPGDLTSGASITIYIAGAYSADAGHP